MRHFLSLLFAISVLFVASAQEAAPPAEPTVDPLAVVEGALVRFVHASPNAGPASVVLTSSTAGLDERHVIEMEYMASTEYRRLPEGRYEITVEPFGQDGDGMVMAEQLHTIPGGVYTVALVGLVLDEPEDEVGPGNGLLDWIQGLFTADRPELALRALVLDDAGGAVAGPDWVAYRVVHAAPGTDRVELVHVRDDDADVLATVSYLDASTFSDVAPDVGTLEVRAAGTTATIDALSDVHHAPGRIHTVFLVGTPIEEMPLQTLVVTADWAELGPMGVGAAGAMRMTGVMTAPELATMRALLVALGERIEAAGQQLEELAGAPADEGAVTDTRREINEAMLLLEQAHQLLDSAEHRVP